jgi:hypothetical protein
MVHIVTVSVTFVWCILLLYVKRLYRASCYGGCNDCVVQIANVRVTFELCILLHYVQRL